MFKKLALILVFTLAFASTAFAKDFTYDITSGGWAGGDGGNIEVNTDKLPVDNDVKYEEKASLRVNITKSASWWAGQAQFDKEYDLTAYKDNGYVQFAIKGEKGGEKITAGLRSGEYTKGNEVNAMLDVTATADWTIVKLPIKEIASKYPNLQLDKVNAFQVRNANTDTLKVWVADFKVADGSSDAAPAGDKSSTDKAASGDTQAANPKTGDTGVMTYALILAASAAVLIAARKIS